MCLPRLLHFLLIGLLILGQVATPALATQLTNLSQPALSQNTSYAAKPSCHEQATPATHVTDHMENADTSNAISNDCCGDECQCPMGSCSSSGLNVIHYTHLSVEPNAVITFEHFSPLQRYLPPLLKPPIS